MKKLLSFLQELEDRKIFYKVEKVREAIMVVAVVPGERWEIEFFDDGVVVIEKFKSDGTIYNEDEISTLFDCFSD